MIFINFYERSSGISIFLKLENLFLTLIFFLFSTLLVAANVKSYPTRPVRVLVGLGAGGGADTIARITSQKLTEILGQSFIVDNRPSAGGSIACEIVAHAVPDGYTLLAMSPTHTATPSLRNNPGYDVIKDFDPIALTVFTPYVLSVRTALPIYTVKDLISTAKIKPLIYASSGIGGGNHLTAELFNHMAGISMTHVPYKSGAQAVSALIMGEVQVSFTAMGGLISHIKSGRIRAIAVTSPKRSAISPEIPTVGESGVPGYEVIGWYGLATTANTPKFIIEQLNKNTNHAIHQLKDKFAEIGTEIAGGSHELFKDFIKTEFIKWAKVIKYAGIKPE